MATVTSTKSHTCLQHIYKLFAVEYSELPHIVMELPQVENFHVISKKIICKTTVFFFSMAQKVIDCYFHKKRTAFQISRF